MRNIWFSSDWHLGHSKVLTFSDKNGNKIRSQFSNVNEMNECILQLHNERVKPGDLYYNLGDVFFGSKIEFEKIMPKFQGRKRLVIGNHDDVPYLVKTGFFQKILMWRQMIEHGLLFSHVPVQELSLERKPNTPKLFNVHGHTHAHGSPPGPYHSVCVELTDYKPIHLDELKEIFSKKKLTFDSESPIL